MPTLVAVRVAAAMIDGMSDNPRQRQATYPSTKGSKTPTTATVIDVGPTRISRARSVSRPIANRRINTPSSARSWIASWPGSIQPSTDGPGHHSADQFAQDRGLTEGLRDGPGHLGQTSR